MLKCLQYKHYIRNKKLKPKEKCQKCQIDEKPSFILRGTYYEKCEKEIREIQKRLEAEAMPLYRSNKLKGNIKFRSIFHLPCGKFRRALWWTWEEYAKSEPYAHTNCFGRNVRLWFECEEEERTEENVFLKKRIRAGGLLRQGRLASWENRENGLSSEPLTLEMPRSRFFDIIVFLNTFTINQYDIFDEIRQTNGTKIENQVIDTFTIQIYAQSLFIHDLELFSMLLANFFQMTHWYYDYRSSMDRSMLKN